MLPPHMLPGPNLTHPGKRRRKRQCQDPVQALPLLPPKPEIMIPNDVRPLPPPSGYAAPRMLPSAPQREPLMSHSVPPSTQHGADLDEWFQTRRKRYKGIRRSRAGKWVARIERNNRQKHLGTFTTPAEAAIAYDKALYQILAMTQPGHITPVQLKRFNFPDRIHGYPTSSGTPEPEFPYQVPTPLKALGPTPIKHPGNGLSRRQVVPRSQSDPGHIQQDIHNEIPFGVDPGM